MRRVVLDWASPSWDAEFKEDEHKRDESGQFIGWGGGSESSHVKVADDLVTKRGLQGAGKFVRGKLARLRREEPADSPNRIHWGRVLNELDNRALRGGSDSIAFDSAEGIRQRALDTARRLSRLASDRMPRPRLAFDRAFVGHELRSQIVRLAFDRASVRTFSPDGHMHVALSSISRAQCSPYWGKEIPDAEQLGLDLNKKYILLRHPDELRKSTPTWNGIPILGDHKPISAADHPHELVVGSTGTDARYEHPMLQNSLHFWEKSAIDAIRSGERRELSGAYHYRPEMVPGIYEGKRYDGIMRDIVANHLALVEDGRVGPVAVVADAMPSGLRVYR